MSDVDKSTSDRVVDLAPSAAASTLETLGATSVIPFPDVLTHGPVSPDSKRHRKQRLKYLRGFYASLYSGDVAAIKERVDAAMQPFEDGYLTTEQLGSAAGREAKGGRFVIWTTPTLEDRVFLWFACHALLEEGVAIDQIGIAEPQILLPSDVPEEARYANLSQLADVEFEAVFDEVFYPEPIYVETAANLWETFATVSPRQLNMSVGHTRKFFPQFFVFIQDYAFLFPRVSELSGYLQKKSSAGALRLSQFDHDLFSSLDEPEFRSAEEVLDEAFLEKYEYLGPLVALSRLRVWGESRGDEAPYIIVEPCEPNEADSSNPLTQFRYKRGKRGTVLLEEGFDAGRKLPVFTVGNARTYASKKPWVSAGDGQRWDFERFKPTD